MASCARLRPWRNAARALGAEIDFLTPRDFNSLPMPTYPEIALAIATPRAVRRRLDDRLRSCPYRDRRADRPRDARRLPARAPLLHDEFPHALSGIYSGALRLAGRSVLYGAAPFPQRRRRGYGVDAEPRAGTLRARVSTVCLRWSRGVDHALFTPDAATAASALPRPIFLYAGRLAVEKNIEAFLSLDLPGTKIVAGDGPARAALEAEFPQARFRRASRRAPNSRRSTPPPTFSSFRAAPTLSAWCCWRRWPAACR